MNNTATRSDHSDNKSDIIIRRDEIKGIQITNLDILHALATLDPCEDHRARTWYVKYGEHDYPLKETVRRAVEHAPENPAPENLNEEGRLSFYPDRSGKRLLNSLGFDPVERRLDSDTDR